MGAKDTVMSREKDVEVQLKKVTELGLKDILELSNEQFRDAILEAQAEISFKAGYDEGYLDGGGEIAKGAIKDRERHHRAGIREVVEWIDNRAKQCLSGQKFFEHIRKEWQAKLKEWRLDNPTDGVV